MATIRQTLISICFLMMSWSAAVADALVTLTITDRLGRSVAAPFSIIDQDRKVIGVAELSRLASVPAGTWQLVPEGHNRLARQITTTDGQNLAVTINVPDSVWVALDPSYDSAPRWVLIVPKPRADMLRALTKFDLSRRYNVPLAARRPGVSPNAAAASLALARETYGKPIQDRSDVGAEQHLNAHIWAGRILSALGDDTDVARLTSDPPPHSAFDDLLIAARIERRLGTISRGRLASIADGPSDRALHAAVLLRHAGLTRWDQRIADALLSAAGPFAAGSTPWLAALPLRSATVDRAFAGAVDRLVAREAELAALPESQRAGTYNQHRGLLLPLILHSLLNENNTQLRKLTEFPLPSLDGISLALFIANPDAISRFLMLRSVSKDPDDTTTIRDVANLCPVLELLSLQEADRVWAALVASVRDAGAKAAQRRTLAPGVARVLPYEFVDFFMAAASACRPSSIVTTKLYEDQDSGLPFNSWIPRTQRKDEMVGYLVKPPWRNFNWRRVDMVLETIPVDVLQSELAAKGAERPAYPINVYLAYRQVATRANYLFPVYLEDGLLSATRRDLAGRPYVFANKSYEGGLIGIASVEVEPRSDVVRFRIRLNQRAHYGRAGLFENRKDNAEWKLHPYTLDRGRKLIREVSLRRKDTPIAIKEVEPDGSGAVVFETGRIDDWADSVLQIDLAMFDETRSLLFELFAAELPTR